MKKRIKLNNEKENKIENIYNVFNYISKSFLSYYKNNKNIDCDNDELQLYDKYNLENENQRYYDPKFKFKYFYFDDNTFAIFVNDKKKNYLYIVYLSEGNVKKIGLNCLIDKNENLNIENIFYSKENEKEKIYIFISDKNVKGIVYDKENKIG